MGPKKTSNQFHVHPTLILDLLLPFRLRSRAPLVLLSKRPTGACNYCGFGVGLAYFWQLKITHEAERLSGSHEVPSSKPNKQQHTASLKLLAELFKQLQKCLEEMACFKFTAIFILNACGVGQMILKKGTMLLISVTAIFQF